jgi:HamA
LENQTPPSSIATFVASLTEGHGDLGARLRVISHSVKSKNDRVKLHAHFLAFRDGQPTVAEFVDVLSFKLVPFCLHRKHIQQIQNSWNTLPASRIQESAVRLHQQALELFKRANRKTNRNGEFGELITYLLIETVLKAPQFVAKMSLKTNSEMPIHGSDGIHLGYDDQTGKLSLYWGESKCYASVQSAINKAAESIAENLQHDKLSRELFLVEQYFDLAGFPNGFREAILSFLNPYDENYNKRADVSVIFIAFDFVAFAALNELSPDEVEIKFSVELRAALADYVVRIDKALENHGVRKHSVEVFFLPVPSVDEMRSLFQDKIGWTE